MCGYVSPDRFAAGRMALDRDRSISAIGKLADQLGKDVVTVADEMIRIAVANTYAELSNVMERKGFDPRELSVVAYGGGGPVTASLVAEELHAKDVFVPYRPGTLCAMGALSADFAYDAVSVEQAALDALTAGELDAKLSSLESEARKWLAAQQTQATEGGTETVRFFADARYAGQSYEIQIPLDRTALEKTGVEGVAAAFHAEHARLYGHSEPDAAVELVSVRARIVATTPDLPAIAVARNNDPHELSPKKTRPFACGGRTWDAAVYEREAFGPGDSAQGPAIIEQDDTTVVVLPGWRAVADENLNLTLTAAKQDSAQAVAGSSRASDTPANPGNPAEQER